MDENIKIINQNTITINNNETNNQNRYIFNNSGVNSLSINKLNIIKDEKKLENLELLIKNSNILKKVNIKTKINLFKNNRCFNLRNNLLINQSFLFNYNKHNSCINYVGDKSLSSITRYIYESNYIDILINLETKARNTYGINSISIIPIIKYYLFNYYVNSCINYNYTDNSIDIKNIVSLNSNNNKEHIESNNNSYIGYNLHKSLQNEETFNTISYYYNTDSKSFYNYLSKPDYIELKMLQNNDLFNIHSTSITGKNSISKKEVKNTQNENLSNKSFNYEINYLSEFNLEKSNKENINSICERLEKLYMNIGITDEHYFDSGNYYYSNSNKLHLSNNLFYLNGYVDNAITLSHKDLDITYNTCVGFNIYKYNYIIFCIENNGFNFSFNICFKNSYLSLMFPLVYFNNNNSKSSFRYHSSDLTNSFYQRFSSSVINLSINLISSNIIYYCLKYYSNYKSNKNKKEKLSLIKKELSYLKTNFINKTNAIKSYSESNHLKQLNILKNENLKNNNYESLIVNFCLYGKQSKLTRIYNDIVFQNTNSVYITDEDYRLKYVDKEKSEIIDITIQSKYLINYKTLTVNNNKKEISHLVLDDYALNPCNKNNNYLGIFNPVRCDINESKPYILIVYKYKNNDYVLFNKVLKKNNLIEIPKDFNIKLCSE